MISKDEWNSLSDDEKEARCKEFVLFIEQGVPVGLSDLTCYAEKFGTPVPQYDVNGKVSFEGYVMEKKGIYGGNFT